MATEGVVGVGGGDAGGGTGGDGQAGLDNRFSRKSRARGQGRLGRRMGRTVEEGAGDGGVAERVEGMGFRDKDGSVLNKRRGRRTPRSRPFGRPLRGRGILPIICQPLISVVCQPGEAGAGEADTG